MKQLFLGNEAVARGIYEAGCRVVSSYPGTPSTEITEYCAEYSDMYSEWAPNEKVACEVAVGASIAGARSFCGMKHVGLNVAADPLFTVAYTGVGGGMVIGVADDPGIHSSQNEQDSRHYAIAAKVPMIEPSDSAECLAYTKAAFELSEQFDTPFILRLTTRIAHSRSLVEIGERVEVPLKDNAKNPQKYVMMPANAIKRHVFVEERTVKLTQYAETSPLNRVELNKGAKIGVITAGDCYTYAKEALSDKAGYLKLGLVNPLPVKLIQDFAAQFETVYVLEELDPIIENHCRLIGVPVVGKEKFTLLGEYSAAMIKSVVFGEKSEFKQLSEELPVRPPVLCAGCPHRGVFHILGKLRCTVSGDIGCYTLGALPPLGAIDSVICMGASISALHGMNKARGDEFSKKSVAVIGDSTFIHSGITGLIDISYNMGNSTVIVLDNSITGMTGHQENPSTGYTIKGQETTKINLEALAKACGFNMVTVVDPYDLAATEAAIKTALAADEPAMVIARRPCALLKTVKAEPALAVDTAKCTGCKMCMKIGCPAIRFDSDTKKAVVDETLCVGCGVCTQMCKFGAL